MGSTTRREFILKTLKNGAAISVGCLLVGGKGLFSFPESAAGSARSPDHRHKYEDAPGREAMYYTRLDRDRVRCDLCNRSCLITSGKRGFCRNRENRQGKLYSVVYGRPSAIHVDPVEKEPQHHMLPGTEMLSIGTAGCNFRCLHCHNWHLSQRSIEEIGLYYELTPRQIVDQALKLGVRTISSTYNEPTVFYEYVLDIARTARGEGLKILWHSNGYIQPAPLKELLGHTDAVTIDLKGFSRKAYDNSSAELEPVLRTLVEIKQSGTWLEVVNLVIPGLNDSRPEIQELCEWVRDNLSSEVPLHFSRFFPNYRLTTLPPTPVDILESAYETAREVGLHYVTLGNVPGHEYNSTFCPQCGKTLIRRIHFSIAENHIENGACAFCGHGIPGIWDMN